jgi:hypothetical protein
MPHAAEASSPVLIQVILLLNLVSSLFTVAASEFSRHLATGRCSCWYLQEKVLAGVIFLLWRYKIVFWLARDSRPVAFLVGTSGYDYREWGVGKYWFSCLFFGTSEFLYLVLNFIYVTRRASISVMPEYIITLVLWAYQHGSHEECLGWAWWVGRRARLFFGVIDCVLWMSADFRKAVYFLAFSYG